MVCDDEPIERPIQTGGQAGTRGDGVAAREPIGVLRPERVADHAGVGGVRRVQVRIAEVDPVGEVLLRVG